MDFIVLVLAISLAAIGLWSGWFWRDRKLGRSSGGVPDKPTPPPEFDEYGLPNWEEIEKDEVCPECGCKGFVKKKRQRR